MRRVRDLPLFEHQVVLHVPRRQVWSDHCGGPRMEKRDWQGHCQRVAERFAKACEKLLHPASVQPSKNWAGTRSRPSTRPGLREAGGTAIRDLVTDESRCIRAFAIPPW